MFITAYYVPTIAQPSLLLYSLLWQPKLTGYNFIFPTLGYPYRDKQHTGNNTGNMSGMIVSSL